IALRQTNQIKEIVKEETRSVEGVFRIGVLPTIAPYLLPRFFPELMEEYPSLDIRVTEMKTQECLEALKGGVLEAVLIAGAAEGDHF
ncbi:hydrogen peroxide-inducible genes activator, partial [Staphylococcus aureus]|nr:hydrogen peroxide-inducible genes activator [Staphylococcus aureus]